MSPVPGDSRRGRITRRLAGAGLLATTAALAGAAGARVVLHRQAAQARRAIGKPLGEVAPVSDGLYKRTYGDPLVLAVLGDSLAAGLGADRAKDTVAAHLARRTARATRRSVRLHVVADVGAESWQLAGQVGRLRERGVRPDVAVVVVGGNDVTHRLKVSDSVEHLRAAITDLQAPGAEVVVGTCPDLGALAAVPQPLRSLAGLSSRQLAAAQREAAVTAGAWAVSLAHVVGPFFLTQPDVMFSQDRFHPSSAGQRRTAKALLPSVLAALRVREGDVPFGHHAPVPAAPSRTDGGALSAPAPRPAPGAAPPGGW